jgi:hypothetical protein
MLGKLGRLIPAQPASANAAISAKAADGNEWRKRIIFNSPN